MEKIIDLEKVKSALEKLESNPVLFDGLNSELIKFKENLGIKLNDFELKYLLKEIITIDVADGPKGNWLCLGCVS